MRDYTVVVHMDDPENFDRLEATLQGNWEAEMKCSPTGDSWRKQGRVRETSANAPAEFVAEDDTNGDELFG